jgi:WD40 repeat protein
VQPCPVHPPPKRPTKPASKKLWDIGGQEQKTLKGHESFVRSVSFAPVRGASPEGKGQTLASASADGTVKLWDLNGRELQTLEGQTGNVLSVSFTPDGQTLASASADGMIILWNFNLDDLIAKSCTWLRGYMLRRSPKKNLPNIARSL